MNPAPLRSSRWYRVADLRPRLASRARLHRHQYRGQVWYLLQDPASGRVHRFTASARLALAAMDGRRSVDELWLLVRRKLGEEAPTQDDFIQLLGQLHAADLLMTDVPPDAIELFERGQRERAAKRKRSWINPMSLRIPLWDPGRFLDRHAAWWPRLWGPAAGIAWLLMVLPALLLLPSQWPELTRNVGDRILQPDNLLLLAVVFPILKALHEMGHATATRAAGGEVHDMGVMLLVLMPVPYVDASSASVLRSRWQRARIGAAGMLVEVLVAALAFHVWMLLEPGLARAVCFNVMLVAGVSTLVFNGNPLLRYDAYYILCDLIEVPNLGARAARYWGHLIQRHLLRLRDGAPVAESRSERVWFAVYGLLSAVYRIFVTVSIALFVGSKFFFIGAMLAIWAVASTVVTPLVRALKALHAVPEVQLRPGRVQARLALLVGLLVLAFVVLPLPYRSQAEGVVWLPEDAIVRAATAGFFRQFEVAPGGWVEAGSTVAQSINPELDARIRLLRARVGELEASHRVAFVTDRPGAAIIREQLEQERAALQRELERAQGLLASAGSAGRLTVPQAADLPGRYLQQGEVIGYLLGVATPVVRVVLDQASIDPVTSATRALEIRLAGAFDAAYRGRILRQVPAGSSEVPSGALLQAGGGPLAMDPRDPQGRRTLERIFEIDVEFVDQPERAPPHGQRVHLRFEHPPAPLAEQSWQALRRLFLHHFNV